MTLVEFSQVIQRDSRALSYLLQADEVVYAKHLEKNTVKKVRLKALHGNDPMFWRKSGQSWKYYLDKETVGVMQEFFAVTDRSAHSLGPLPGTPPKAPEPQITPSTQKEVSSDPSVVPPNFGDEYKAIKSLSPEERYELLARYKSRVDEALHNKPPDPVERMEVLVDSARDAAIVNQVAIQDAIGMDDDTAQSYTQKVVENTEELIRSTSRLIQAQEVLDDEMMAALVQKSNGTVVQHMTRVFLNAFTFLHFYNRMVTTSSIANKLRVKFNSKYKDFYRTLLPHLHEDHVTMERVFLGGIRALSDQEINKFGVGFLVHDIGKVDDIEYHEGEAAYDRDTVVAHVKKGYQAIINKTTYTREAALITGYHHEYYGDPAGYGYFREFLATYQKSNPKAQLSACIAYSIEEVLDFKALSYFPAKVLEIVDVFDSLTDKNRRYRKPLSPEEALKVIREEFIVQHHKIDPILFDLFEAFMQSQ